MFLATVLRRAFWSGGGASGTALSFVLFVLMGGCAGTKAGAGTAGAGGGAGATGAGGAASPLDDGGVLFAHHDGPLPSYDGATDMPRVVGGAPLGDAACAAQTQQAQKAPLDMYIMLDSSYSMTETVGTTRTTKWQAITAALTTFLRDPSSAGIGVGLQYFPLVNASVPQECNLDTDCGASGPCDIQRTCVGGTTIKACSTDADCGAAAPCARLGICPANQTLACTQFNPCGGGRNNACVLIAGNCHLRDSCSNASYAMPTVEVAPLPGAAAALTTWLGAHVPDGDTPTAAALTGAISHAQSLGKASPTHRVVALLATDGIPNECTPIDDPGLASIAASGLSGTPSISTFAIGVFGAGEQQAGQATLNAIAMAGGTKQAFVINQQQNVEQLFLSALNSVRTAALSCEFKVPTPAAGQTLDYYAVNVQFTSGAGKSVTIGNVKNKAACDARQGGWYYDVDPATGTPQTISVCDTSCAALQGDPAGRVDVLLGCKTEYIVP
jgi:hypothetical protein